MIVCRVTQLARSSVGCLNMDIWTSIIITLSLLALVFIRYFGTLSKIKDLFCVENLHNFPCWWWLQIINNLFISSIILRLPGKEVYVRMYNYILFSVTRDVCDYGMKNLDICQFLNQNTPRSRRDTMVVCSSFIVIVNKTNWWSIHSYPAKTRFTTASC